MMAALDAEARAARRRNLERWILPTTARPMSDATISGSSPSARSSSERRHIEYKTIPGEVALYGPEIDIKLLDAIGRPWQLTTVACLCR